MNDFVQVVLLRGALVRALEERGELRFDELGSAVFGALRLAPELFMKEAVGRGPYEDARRTMIDLLEYRTLEDLARAWRSPSRTSSSAGSCASTTMVSPSSRPTTRCGRAGDRRGDAGTA